jgi:hypothetical protein
MISLVAGRVGEILGFLVQEIVVKRRLVWGFS